MDINLIQIYFNTLITAILDTYLIDRDCVFIFSERDDFNIHPKIPFIRWHLSPKVELDDVMGSLGNFKCQFWIIQVDDFGKILPLYQRGIRLSRYRHGSRRVLFVPSLKDNHGNWSDLRIKVTELFKTPQLQNDPHLVFLIPLELDQKYCKDNYLKLAMEKNIFETRGVVKPDPIFCQGLNGNGSKEAKYLIEFLTHRFVGLSNRSDPITLDLWSPDTARFLFNNNILPDKVKDFRGRELRIQVLNYPPPIIVSRNFVDGTEVRLCSEYAASINGSVMILNDEKYEWGEFYENGTGNGVWGNIAMGNADFGLGAVNYLGEAEPFLDLSQYISKSSVILLTPKARRLTSFLMPAFPFTPAVWFFTSLVVIFIILTFKILTKIDRIVLERKQNDQKALLRFLNAAQHKDSITLPRSFHTIESIIISFGIVVEQTFPDSVRYGSTNLKHYLIWVLIYSLLLNCSYNSGLAATLTSPRFEKSVKTMQDVIDFKMEWGASHPAWLYIIMYDTSPKQVQLRKQFRALTVAELARRTRTRDFGFLIERYMFGSYAIGSWINEESVQNLQTTDEDVYNCMVTALMMKHSIHAEKFNMFTLRIHAAGIIYYWEGDMTRKYLNMRLVRYVEFSRYKKNDDEPPVKLQMAHLKGLYALWVFGLLLSLISFLIEISISKINMMIKKPSS